jgi:hypothetical protein
MLDSDILFNCTCLETKFRFYAHDKQRLKIMRYIFESFSAKSGFRSSIVKPSAAFTLFLYPVITFILH